MTSHRRFSGALFIGSHAVAEGLLTRRQLAAGYRRVLHNVYADPSLVHDHELRTRAAALLMPAEAVIGGRSAAVWFGAPFSSAVDPVLVLAPPAHPWQGPRGVQVHRSEFREDEVWATGDGVRLTTAVRTAWEIATLEPLLTAVALLDGMLRQGKVEGGGLTEADLVGEVLRRRGQWRSRRANAVLPLVDSRAMSPPESKVRVMCHLGGLPHPVPQYEVVEDGEFLGQVDLAWPGAKLIVEYEGEYHFDELQIRRDDRRYERLVRAGWRVIRLSAVDLRDLDGVVERIRAALGEGARR
ncbi:endonuclease domain-containing protein [Geodermatophilus sp. SYSU D00691]